jgi:hypothetical protein
MSSSYSWIPKFTASLGLVSAKKRFFEDVEKYKKPKKMLKYIFSRRNFYEVL